MNVVRKVYDGHEVFTYDDIKSVQLALLEMPYSYKSGEYPVIHRWAFGMYSRELFMRRGMMLVSKMHAKSHFLTILSGRITIIQDKTITDIRAPFVMTTELGTKRIIMAHEDTRLVTYHATMKTSVNDVEEEIIVPPERETLYIEKLAELRGSAENYHEERANFQLTTAR